MFIMEENCVFFPSLLFLSSYFFYVYHERILCVLPMFLSSNIFYVYHGWILCVLPMFLSSNIFYVYYGWILCVLPIISSMFIMYTLSSHPSLSCAVELSPPQWAEHCRLPWPLWPSWRSCSWWGPAPAAAPWPAPNQPTNKTATWSDPLSIGRRTTRVYYWRYWIKFQIFLT